MIIINIILKIVVGVCAALYLVTHDLPWYAVTVFTFAAISSTSSTNLNYTVTYKRKQ
jgi:hypothetical protein